MISKLQVSDLHLGDPRSVLRDPDAARRVVDQIATIAGGEVGTLICAGDVHEECIPSNMTDLDRGVARSVLVDSEHFFALLFSRVRVGEVVIVPGNHDLQSWWWYAGQRRINRVTPPAGVEVDPSSWPWSLLYPGFGGRMRFAYPLFCDDSSYPLHAVTHGHLLDPLVVGRGSGAAYAILEALGCRRPDVPGDVGEVECVSALARLTMDFTLHLWKRYSHRDYVYANYVMRRLEHPESCQWQELLATDGIYPLDPGDRSDDPPGPSGCGSSVGWFLDLLVADPELPTPVGTLGAGPPPDALTKLSCLTHGHDHLGTYRRVVACGIPFVVASSGGWTSEYEGHRPHTHVLVWHTPSGVPTAYFVKTR
jgi:hypothetical protein